MNFKNLKKKEILTFLEIQFEILPTLLRCLTLLLTRKFFISLVSRWTMCTIHEQDFTALSLIMVKFAKPDSHKYVNDNCTSNFRDSFGN